MSKFPLHPIRHWRRWLAVLLGLAALYTLCGFFLAPVVMKNVTADRLSARLDRDVSIESAGFNPYTLAGELRGIRISAEKGDQPWISLDRFFFDLQAASLFKQALILKRLEIGNPFVAVVRKPDGAYNIPAAPARDAPARQEAGEEAFRFSLNNIVVTGGRVSFRDMVAGVRHRVTGLTLKIPSISNLPYALDEYVDLLFAAQVNAMSVRMDGRAKPFADTMQTRVDLSFRGLELTNYLQYLPGPRNFTFSGGSLSSDLVLDYGKPRDEAPYLRLQGGLSVEDIRCTETSGGEHRFFRIPAASLEMGRGNLLAGEILLDSVELRKPEVSVVRESDGSFLLPSLGGPERTGDAKRSDTGGGFLKLSVNRFRIVGGKAGWTDRSAAPGFSTTLDPVNVEVTGFNPSSPQKARYSLSLSTNAGESLESNGTLGLDPLRVEAGLCLATIPVSRYAPYYGPFFLGSVQSGLLDLDTTVRLDLAGERMLRFDRTSLRLSSLSIDDPGGNRILELPELAIRDSAADVFRGRIAVGSVSSRGGNATLVRTGDGSINFRSLLPASAPEPDIPVPPDPDEPWGVSLEKIDLNGFQAVFTDRAAASTLRLQIAGIDAAARGLSTLGGDPGSVNATLRLASGGKLRVKGEMGLAPLAGRLDLSLSDLSLANLQPYLALRDNLELAGRLGADGSLMMGQTEQGGSPGVGYRGSVRVADLKAGTPQQEHGLLSWSLLEVQGIEAGTSPVRFSAGSVALQEPHARLSVLEDGSTNFAQIFSGPKQKQPEQGAAVRAGPISFSVRETSIDRGAFSFQDFRLKPRFRLEVTQLDGRIGELASDRSKPAAVSLEGVVAGQGPMRVSGEVDPLGDPLIADLEVSLSDIGMPSFSSYLGRYLGYSIDKGKLFLETQASIRGRKLRSRNEVRLDNFDLGEKVQSPSAVNAPIKLGLALLKNRDGEIRITKEVSGDLSDPSFSVGDLVMQVFVNVIAKAATSPFAFLGAIFGGGQDISHVAFEPGKAEPDAEARNKMKVLAQAMYERPALKIDLLGRADPSADRKALLEERFLRLLKAQKLQDLEKAGKTAPALKDIRIDSGEFEKYLWLAYKAAPMEKPAGLLGRPRKLPPEEQEQRLREHIEITDEDLLKLARQRAAAVRDFIMEAGPVESDRIFLLKPQTGSGQEAAGGVELRMH